MRWIAWPLWTRDEDLPRVLGLPQLGPLAPAPGLVASAAIARARLERDRR